MPDALLLVLHPTQVASFCGTVMAAQQVAQGQLPVGRSQAESELLLQQTHEAMELDLRCT